MQNDFELTTVEYLIGNLSLQQRRDFQDRLLHRSDVNEVIERWESELSKLLTLTFGTESQVAPTPHLWSRIEAEIWPPLAPPRARLSERIVQGMRLLLFPLQRKWSSGFATGFAVAAVLAVLSGAFDPTRPFVSHEAELIASGKLRSNVRLLKVPWPAAEIRTSMLEEQPQESLQLWIIKPGEPPMSLGLIHSHAHYIWLDQSLEMPCDTTLAVSLEPQGGSQMASPTGPVIASAKFVPH